MENQRVVVSGLVGGIVAALFSALPYINFINCFCCLGIMLGGAAGMIYYDRYDPTAAYLSQAEAVTLGITSGLFGAFIALFADWFIYLNFGYWELDFLRGLLDSMEEVPQALDEMMLALEEEMSKGFMWGSSLLQYLFLMPAFCLAGALITRILLNKNRSPEGI